MNTRIILDILLFVAVFIVPPWLVLLVASLCLFLFKDFYEIIFLGIIMDFLFGVPTQFFVFPVIYTLLASIIFLIRISLRNHLTF